MESIQSLNELNSSEKILIKNQHIRFNDDSELDDDVKFNEDINFMINIMNI